MADASQVAIKDQLEHEIKMWSQMIHPALMQRFVVRQGVISQPLEKLPKSVKKAKKGECFTNAYNLALYSGYQYVEGYATSADFGILIHHAWVLDKDGRVVDNTWDRPAACQYMGVKISNEDLEAETSKNGVYGVLDIGGMINSDFIFAKDPELEKLMDDFMKARHKKVDSFTM